MSLSTNEIIKFIIDNSEVDVDDLLQHLWNIKLNQRIIIINNDEEIVEEVVEVEVVEEVEIVEEEVEEEVEDEEEEEDDEDDDEVPED